MFIVLVNSLTYVLNNTGPRRVPCGTPIFTVFAYLNVLFSIDYKFLKVFSATSLTPYFSKMFSRISFDTVHYK